MHKFFCEAYPLKFDRRKVPPRGRANMQRGFGLRGRGGLGRSMPPPRDQTSALAFVRRFLTRSHRCR